MVESGGQLYIRNRRHLKRAAGSDSSLAEEMSSDQPTVENKTTPLINRPVTENNTTPSINQPVTKKNTTPLISQPVTANNATSATSRGPPSRQQVEQESKKRTTPIDATTSQQATGGECGVRTRRVRLVRPQSRFKDFVTLRGTYK